MKRPLITFTFQGVTYDVFLTTGSRLVLKHDNKALAILPDWETLFAACGMPRKEVQPCLLK